MNNKDKLWLMKSSVNFYYRKLLYYTMMDRTLNKENAEELVAAQQIVAMNKEKV